MKRSVFLFLMIILTACGSQAETNAVSVGTKTKVPTETSSPIPSPSKTQTPTVTTWPTYTPNPFSQPEGVNLSHFDVSPSKEWIAWGVCCGEDEYYYHLIVENIQGTKSWFVNNHNVMNDWWNYLFAEHWSVDNKYVYIRTKPVDVDWYIGSHVSALMRLSLETGEVVDILPVEEHQPDYPSKGIYYGVAFSPNSQILVYSIRKDSIIYFTLRDLYTQEERSLEIDTEHEIIYGDISWSPDNKHFVFSLYDGGTIIMLVDSQSLITKQILNVDNQHVVIVVDDEWQSEDKILYYYYDVEEEKEHNFILNIETGEVTEK